MEWVVSTTPRPLYLQERPGTHCIGDWVDPRAGLDGCGKSHPSPGFDPRTVQPVASRCTDWAVLVTACVVYNFVTVSVMHQPVVTVRRIACPVRQLLRLGCKANNINDRRLQHVAA